MSSKTNHEPIGPATIVTGAEFRDFYHNHWPRDWYVEEMPYEAEDERGNWVLPDDARHRLDWFGYAAWQGPADKGRDQGEIIQMHELYAEVMGAEPSEVLVSFKIDADRAEEFVKVAEKFGARHI